MATTKRVSEDVERDRVVRRFRSFQAAFPSTEAGLSEARIWFNSGATLEDAKRLSKTEFGQRLRKYKPDSLLSAPEIAGIFRSGHTISWAALPEPDAMDGLNARMKVTTLARWVADGCSFHGRPANQKFLTACGADRPPKGPSLQDRAVAALANDPLLAAERKKKEALAARMAMA